MQACSHTCSPPVCLGPRHTSHCLPPPSRLAYDGRGNAVVRSGAELDAAVAALGGYAAGLYAERWVRFECELAVMVARSRDGSVVSFPVSQTIHKDSICATTETPALVPAAVAAAARGVAERAVAALDGERAVDALCTLLLCCARCAHCAVHAVPCGRRRRWRVELFIPPGRAFKKVSNVVLCS